jgi:hypothetical protein
VEDVMGKERKGAERGREGKAGSRGIETRREGDSGGE